MIFFKKRKRKLLAALRNDSPQPAPKFRGTIKLANAARRKNFGGLDGTKQGGKPKYSS